MVTRQGAVVLAYNLHREKILPSEKAFAYKMRLEAMKHQGKEITLDQIGPKPEKNGLQIYPLKVEQGQFGEMIIAPTEKKILSRRHLCQDGSW